MDTFLMIGVSLKIPKLTDSACNPSTCFCEIKCLHFFGFYFIPFTDFHLLGGASTYISPPATLKKNILVAMATVAMATAQGSIIIVLQPKNMTYVNDKVTGHFSLPGHVKQLRLPCA